MYKKILISIFSILFIISSPSNTAQKAVVIVPIADCVGKPLQAFYPDQNIEKIYHNIPISWAGEKNSIYSCPRVHQLLFNEVVDIIDQKDNEVCVALPNMFYQKADSQTRYNSFWTLRKNLKQLEDIKSADSVIPKPVSFEKPYQIDNKIISLKLPFFDDVTQKTYSAGTRFLIKERNKHAYKIIIYDPQEGHQVTTTIPATVCYEPFNKTRKERISDFVTLLRLWALSDNGSVPLVWGGISFMPQQKISSYEINKKTLENGELVEYWQPQPTQARPYSGFDASGLILRATQICGVPYFFKNTGTAANHMRALNSNETLQEGDLLFVPGGLLVISDIKNNRILAAMGYQFGYGKVVELPLNRYLENIATYQDLLSNFLQQIPLYTKKADGTRSREISDYKLLKLSSLWD